MPLKACDRCYSAKEKCSFTDDEQQCTRCRRLKLSCSKSRLTRRMGRRPAARAFPHGKVQIWSAQPQGSASSAPGRENPRLLRQSSTPSTVSETRSPDRDDVVILAPERLLARPTTLRTMSDALRTVMDIEQFSVIHMPFMWGASFVPEAQKTVHAILCLSGPTLTEGYLAFLGLMTGYQRSLVMRHGPPDMRQAAKGLQRLRSVTIAHDYDAACALFLGQTMYVFNVLTAPYSSTAHSIVRSALMSTKPWFHRLIRYPIMDTIIMTPVLIDTVECVMHREVPIIRLPETDRVIIDRYAGLCATLLPHLYDTCECSHALKTNAVEAGSELHTGYYERLATIEQRIEAWRPPTPPELYTNFSQQEILAMVTQANVYRLGGLLTIHRLRYPLGVEDGVGRNLANSIFAELSYFANSRFKEATALPVVFPLTLAMLEVEGPGEELMDKLALFTVQTMSASRLQGFVKQVRASRASGYEGLWFDLVETQLHVAAPP
ncbi:hypothetical protein N7492_010322 [Penicillium capsulatum]|uniref:Zn(2)-C6 fungal-type domain-containing protein n=1 Tax=Penicillium capsulatum TaxID=69766 RepID=A0A9W9HM77_9EURO|nr:hypothetical protein N7492_010322 [Penicillium capsulatum]KAJ6112827.1 hypothetical protein N7512_008151 [Penicillium capsulatum]